MATDPAPGLFPGVAEPQYVRSPEVRDLAELVIAEFDEFRPIQEAVLNQGLRIVYAWDTRPFDFVRDEYGPHVIAQVRKAPTWVRDLHGGHVMLEFRRWFWDHFDAAQRRAVIHHELTHLELDGETDELGNPKVKLRKHDVEDFTGTMRRFGPVIPGRREFIKAAMDWQHEQEHPEPTPLRQVTTEDLAHVAGEALADAVARGELGEDVTDTRDVSRFGGLVLPDESLEQAFARLERRGDSTGVIGSDAGQRLLEELNRQRDIRRRTADAPALGVGDAVVDDGVKYRVREITEIGQTAMAQLAAAGPSWKRTAIVRNADVHQLEWDRVAAVWRGPTWETAS